MARDEGKSYPIHSSGFIENKGQIMDQNHRANPSVKYLLCKPGFNVQLRRAGFSYDTYTDEKDLVVEQKPGSPLNCQDSISKKFIRHFHRVDVNLSDCNPSAEINALDTSAAYYNYFTSGTPANGVSKIHYFQKVVYKNIYPQIDLEFFTSHQLSPNMPSSNLERVGVGSLSTNSGFEYDFIVHPGGKVSDIKLSYQGANEVKLENGLLNVKVEAGTFAEHIPRSYMKSSGNQVKVDYGLSDKNTYSFIVQEPISWTDDLIIDPTPDLLWATYFGGDRDDNNHHGIATDASNNVYITGVTNGASNIATSGSYNATYTGSTDVYIAAFKASDVSLMWATYYGGDGLDEGWRIILDASNNIYITGYTTSSSSIARGTVFQSALAGGYDAFIANFNSTGTTLLWGSYFGGPDYDQVRGIALDAINNVYISGYTSSVTQIASGTVYQSIHGGINDAFVAKIEPTGSTLLWATYFGGEADDQANSIRVDASNNVYITGTTSSTTGISTIGVYQINKTAGLHNAFIAKLNFLGASVDWATYYGGEADDEACCISVGSDNNIYIAGVTTSSSGISSSTGYQQNYEGNCDAFVAKLNSTGTTLLGSSYYGGTGIDRTNDMIMDAQNNMYISGYTDSRAKISTPGVYQPFFGGTVDAFIAKIDPSMSSLIWGTYFGGSDWDHGHALTLDAAQKVYLSGDLSSDHNISTPGTYQPDFGGGGCDAFVAMFSNTFTVNYTVTPVSCNGASDGSILTTQPGTIPGYTYLWNNGQTTQNLTGLAAGTYSVTVTDAASVVVAYSTVISQPAPITESTCCDTIIKTGEHASLKVSTATSNTIRWYPVTGLSCNTCPSIIASPSITTTYIVKIIDINGCERSDSVKVTVPKLCGDIFVPDAFSPNGDPNNEKFYVRQSPPCTLEMNLRVFNRWGQQVFESRELNIGWDGTFNGTVLLDDVFFYIVNITPSNGEQPVVKKGCVSLIR